MAPRGPLYPVKDSFTKNNYFLANESSYIENVIENNSPSNIQQNLKLPEIVATERLYGNMTAPKQSAECGRDGILTVQYGGRFGNLMGEYATLWAMAKRDALIPVLQAETQRMLSKVFTGISVPSVSSLGKCDIKWNKITSSHYHSLSNSEKQRMARDGIFIDGYPCDVQLFHPHREQLTKEFKFSKNLIDTAQNKLRLLSEERPEITFVGVHARRTG